MSIKCMTWAWQQRGLYPTQKLLLLKYASICDENFWTCCPSLSFLATDICTSEQTVRRINRELEQLGLIKLVNRFDPDTGAQLPNQVELLIDSNLHGDQQ
jgi:hypothetical protein